MRQEVQPMEPSAEFQSWWKRACNEQSAAGVAIQRARHDRELAEDVLQEAYWRAWQHSQEIESWEHLQRWLRVVVINLLREHFRRKENQTQLLEYPENIPDRRRRLVDEDALEDVRHHLNRLADDDRLLVQHCHYEGLTLEEIHGLHPKWGSVSTIFRRRARVYQQLRAWMASG